MTNLGKKSDLLNFYSFSNFDIYNLTFNVLNLN